MSPPLTAPFLVFWLLQLVQVLDDLRRHVNRALEEVDMCLRAVLERLSLDDE